MVRIELVPDIEKRMRESWEYADKVLKGKIKIN